jgi:hypothetical protein
MSWTSCTGGPGASEGGFAERVTRNPSIEVLAERVTSTISPSTARWDRFDKRTAYQEKAIPEYWVVDLDTRAFERCRPADQRPELLSKLIRWHPLPEVAPLDIDLVKYFDDVWR